MDIQYDKHDIRHEYVEVDGKSIFVFVNHKAAVPCWAKLAQEPCDLITFDSHDDFYSMLIVKDGDPWAFTHGRTDEPQSRHAAPGQHDVHFSTDVKFVAWGPQSDVQNAQLIAKEHRFLTYNNDNIIDVAFAKNIIGGAFSYYDVNHNAHARNSRITAYGLNDVPHKFKRDHVDKLVQPTQKFILDVDIDFFFRYGDYKHLSCDDAKRDNYGEKIKQLLEDDNCVGMTIALEPGCCGGVENCLDTCKSLGNKIGIDLEKIAEKLFTDMGIV